MSETDKQAIVIEFFKELSETEKERLFIFFHDKHYKENAGVKLKEVKSSGGGLLPPNELKKAARAADYRY